MVEIQWFQSPKSEKFESNKVFYFLLFSRTLLSFNPLNRGNLNQITDGEAFKAALKEAFQSPKSGKFESNSDTKEISS